MRAIAMPVLFVAGCSISAATSRGALVEYSFGGVITAASSAAAGGSPAWTSPNPFTGVQVGQAWSLRFVFESEATRTGINPSVFAGAIRQFSLTIGGASVSQPSAPPGGFAPVGTLALTQSPTLHQYDAAVPLTQAGFPISAGVVLQDSTRSAITDFTRLSASLNYGGFGNGFFFLGPVNAQNQYRGTITSFVPAPGSIAVLLGAGVFASRRRR